MAGLLQPWMRAEDLAPGDGRALDRDWSDITLHEIRSAADPAFPMAYDAMWQEFHPVGEVESEAVLTQRMQANGPSACEGYYLDYRLEMITSHGAFAAVVDHTVIIPETSPGAIVHVSHLLVSPDWRRSGLAGWMRALPVRDAREALVIAGRPANEPILLTAEVEYLDEANPATATRLRAFGKAGYSLVDPQRVSFLQPDFRTPEEIDRSGEVRPVPLTLVLRKVGHETETSIKGASLRAAVSALYAMYGATFRPQDMKPLWESLEKYPGDDEDVALLPPYCLS